MKEKAVAIVRSDCERIASQIEREADVLRGSSILITGGSGFIGSWLVSLICCLNNQFGKNIKLRVMARDQDRFLKTLNVATDASNVEFIRCDIRSMVELPKDVNYVIHAAANPDSRYHSSNPIETMTTISEGTGAVLRAADRVSDLRMFLNISSSSVYGAIDEKALSELTDGLSLCLANKSPYAEAKRYAEALCAAARSEARIPVVTVRPFTFIGPFQNLDAPWAINNFMSDAIRKRPIRVLSDGNTVRSIMYGADLAAWLLIIMLRSKSGRTYNVGSPIGTKLFDLAMKVADHTHPRPEVILNASLTGTTQHSRLVPDTTSAQSEFNLSIFTDLDEAISRTMLWYESLGSVE